MWASHRSFQSYITGSDCELVAISHVRRLCRSARESLKRLPLANPPSSTQFCNLMYTSAANMSLSTLLGSAASLAYGIATLVFFQVLAIWNGYLWRNTKVFNKRVGKGA